MKLLQDFNDLMWVTIVDSELLFVGCECLWSERVDCIHCVTIYSVFVWLSIFLPILILIIPWYCWCGGQESMKIVFGPVLLTKFIQCTLLWHTFRLMHISHALLIDDDRSEECSSWRGYVVDDCSLQTCRLGTLSLLTD